MITLGYIVCAGMKAVYNMSRSYMTLKGPGVMLTPSTAGQASYVMHVVHVMAVGWRATVRLCCGAHLSGHAARGGPSQPH